MKKLIVITGASSGIGEATAKLFSANGYPLLLLARRKERMEALNLPNTISKAVDVTNLEALKAAVKEAEAEFGPTDTIINNAGVMLLGNVLDQDPSEWEKMLDVNVKGLLHGVNAVAKGMVERRQGTIINISSIAGKKSFSNHVAYVGTKFAVHGLTENLREELSQHNVRVVTIAPGAVKTELLGHTTDKQIVKDYTAWAADTGAIISAEDVASAIFFAHQAPQNVCIREIVLAATNQGA
jgi:NADP-dependent 3-hydroxy acid dehydrogenase YdfG